MLNLAIKQSVTIILAIIGAICFICLHLPLPWLLGSIVGIFLSSRIKLLPLEKSKSLLIVARVTIGVILGSSFTPELLHQVKDYVFSLMFVLPYVVFIAYAGMLYYEKVQKFDKVTAYFSAMPGGLVEMVIIGKELGGDAAKITLVQSARLVFIIFCLPFLIEWVSNTSLGDLKPITTPIAQMNLSDSIVMIIVAILGVMIGKKLKIYAPYLLGPMLMSIIAYSLGFIEQRPPDEFLKAMQVILGISIGIVFKGVSTKIVLKTLINSLGFLLILTTISAIMIAIIHTLLGFPLTSVILAFSPGGQANINLIAIILGADIPYIALHHLFRLILVVSGAGYFAKKLR